MLITKEYIISETFTRTISNSRISDSIMNACQLKYLKPILGEDFYDALVAAPTSYTTLMNYIKPMLAWYTKYMILPELRTEISDLGVQRISVQSAQQADDEGYAQMRSQSLVIAEAHRDELIRHLNDNSDDYADFIPGDSPDNKTEIVGGILFRKPAADLDDDDQWYKPT